MAHPLVERARRDGTPVIEGEAATFVWKGKSAPPLIGDFTDWEVPGEPLLKQVAPGVWAHSMVLPPDAYVEYAFAQEEERFPDPFNRRTTPDGMGRINHFFSMPGWKPTPLSRQRGGVVRGMVTRHRVPTHGLAVGRERTVYLYRPALGEKYPLLAVFDGQDYLQRGRLVQIVDNLVAQGLIRPIALALVEHGRAARMVEYACNDATVGFLRESVLPLAQAELDLLDARTASGAHGILGASMGGLMALYAAVRAAHLFGRVLSQSGAFADPGFGPAVLDLIREVPPRALHIWMGVGRLEWLLEANRKACALLQEKGYQVTYSEYNGGHNYTCWRNEVGKGLEALWHP